MNHHKPLSQVVLKWTLFLTAGFMLATIFLTAIIDGMVREDQMRDGLRTERCGRFGENIPPAWMEYCVGVGQ